MLIENPDNKKNPIYDRFRDRITYPIRDNRGRVIAFGGRVMGDDKPKYLNSPETPVFHKGEELYGLFEARRSTRNLGKILIVEGYMDVIALAQNDINYSVATLGTATSTNHLRRLFKLVPEVIFCFDGDNAGREAAWRALEQTLPLMEDGRTARFLLLPNGEDPDTLIRKIGKADFENRVSSATQLAEFFFQSLGDKVDMNSLEGRARLGRMALPYIEKIPTGIYHQLILDQLATITGVDLQTLGKLEKKPEEAPVMDTITVSQRLPRKTRAVGRSVCMRAVNLILLKPDVVNELEDDNELAEIESPDLDLLLHVIELARANPSSTTPELLGRIYATPLGTQLTQLLNREQITPVEGVSQEFREIMNHLLNTHRRQKNHQDSLAQARQMLSSRRNPAENTDSEPNQH